MSTATVAEGQHVKYWNMIWKRKNCLILTILNSNGHGGRYCLHCHSSPHKQFESTLKTHPTQDSTFHKDILFASTILSPQQGCVINPQEHLSGIRRTIHTNILWKILLVRFLDHSTPVPTRKMLQAKIFNLSCFLHKYRKIPKIRPSVYKPLQIYAPQSGNAKNPPLNRPSKYKPPRSLYLEYKVKQSKNGKFTSNYKAFQNKPIEKGL